MTRTVFRGIGWLSLRSDYQGRWSKRLREKLSDNGIPFTDIEAALEPLYTKGARELLAVARLALYEEDDLAWWTLLHVHRGISAAFIRAVADFAAHSGRRFAQQLRRLDEDAIPGITSQSLSRATARIEQVRAVLSEVESLSLPEASNWVSWLRDIAEVLNIGISDDLNDLLTRVEGEAEVSEGVRDVLAQLEPIARDLALEQPGVSIMSVARSKGLTFDVAITVGVENELFPLPLSTVPEEDRRLLYVAITRARKASYLTMARYRNDGTAYTGSGDSVRSRSRCNFLSQAGIQLRDGDQYVRTLDN